MVGVVCPVYTLGSLTPEGFPHRRTADRASANLDVPHVAAAHPLFARARRGVATGSFVNADRGQREAAAWADVPSINPRVTALSCS